MNQQRHEQKCLAKYGKPFAEVHRFLDQYSDLYRGFNHRYLLHHQRGVELVVQQFGEVARGPAEQHILLDWDFLPDSWEDLDKHYFPLSLEEDDLIKAEIKRLFAGDDKCI